MKLSDLYKVFVFIVVVAVFSGCKSLSTHVEIPVRPMPGTYKSSTDTVSIAGFSWKEYFADSSLLSLIDTAIANNPDMQIALQRINMARADVKWSKFRQLPQVAAEAGGGVRRYGLYTMDGAGNATTEVLPGKTVPVNLPDMLLGLRATWEVDIWGKLRNMRHAAFARYLSSVEGSRFVMTNLVADVASNYYELLALDNELEILRQTIRKQEEALAVIEAQKQAGLANELAVQQFSAQLLNSRALEKLTEQRITEMENIINYLLGRYPQPIERQQDDFLEAAPKQLSAGLPSDLLRNRSDIRQAEFDIKASGFDLKAAKAAFLPSFNITGHYGLQAFSPKFLFQFPASLTYSALGGLAAPLVNFNGLKAQFNSAKARQLEAMYNYQRLILKAYSEVATELSNIQTLEQVSEYKIEQSDMLSRAITTSSALYLTGRATYLEVLLAQQNALDARIGLVEIRKQQYMAVIKAYKALGGGWR